MQQTIHYDGQAPLTAETADAALDLILQCGGNGWGPRDECVAAVVAIAFGLAAWFPQLPLETQLWYANAPMILANVTSQWGMLNPWQAHQQEMDEHVRGQIAEWRQQVVQAPQAGQVQNMSVG